MTVGLNPIAIKANGVGLSFGEFSSFLDRAELSMRLSAGAPHKCATPAPVITLQSAITRDAHRAA
jgi:hypothetical protein